MVYVEVNDMKSKKGVLTIFTIALMVGALLFIVDEESQADDGKVIFTSKNFTCQGCEQKLETTLENMIGIENFTINENADEVVIYYDETIMKPEWIEKSFEASGFGEIELK